MDDAYLFHGSAGAAVGDDEATSVHRDKAGADVGGPPQGVVPISAVLASPIRVGVPQVSLRWFSLADLSWSEADDDVSALLSASTNQSVVTPWTQTPWQNPLVQGVDRMTLHHRR